MVPTEIYGDDDDDGYDWHIREEKGAPCSSLAGGSGSALRRRNKVEKSGSFWEQDARCLLSFGFWENAWCLLSVNFHSVTNMIKILALSILPKIFTSIFIVNRDPPILAMPWFWKPIHSLLKPFPSLLSGCVAKKSKHWLTGLVSPGQYPSVKSLWQWWWGWWWWSRWIEDKHKGLRMILTMTTVMTNVPRNQCNDGMKKSGDDCQPAKGWSWFLTTMMSTWTLSSPLLVFRCAL